MGVNKFVMAGVMGWPVAHSRSPTIHNFWIKQYGLSGAYGFFPVPPDKLEQAIRGMAALGIAGCNVTIPHKVHALQFMDWVHPSAEKIGAINTIVVQPDGSLHGYNNDGYGYIQSLREVQSNWQAHDKPIVVIGAGGAARSILVALMSEGATEIRLLNRTLENARTLEKELGPQVIKAYEWDQRHSLLSDCSLVINTTSQGMEGYPPLDLDLAPLPSDAVVSDIIYTPLETPLLKQARLLGLPTINGLGMLLHQARPAFRSWFGIDPLVTDELRNKLLKH